MINNRSELGWEEAVNFDGRWLKKDTNWPCLLQSLGWGFEELAKASLVENFDWCFQTQVGRSEQIFVKANTHCLPLKWRSCSSPFYIMIRIFIRWKLNRLRPWLRKWNTGTTPTVDISFCWSTLCCWYATNHEQTNMFKHMLTKHEQTNMFKHMLTKHEQTQIMSKQICSNIC